MGRKNEDEHHPITPQPIFTCTKCNQVIKWTGTPAGMVFWEYDGYKCYACIFGFKWQ